MSSIAYLEGYVSAFDEPGKKGGNNTLAQQINDLIEQHKQLVETVNQLEQEQDRVNALLNTVGKEKDQLAVEINATRQVLTDNGAPTALAGLPHLSHAVRRSIEHITDTEDFDDEDEDDEEDEDDDEDCDC